MSDIENRYKALIQPIKDIASNWDIDIAESLTEYLEDLDSLRISIDGGKNSLNFAEAALLIQGSTAVYSKKVEYLHQLVLQSLEFITNKKSTTVASAQGGKAAKTVEDDDILFLDNDVSFLLLDHIVEEGHNINLKTTAPNLTNHRNSRNSNSFGSENNTSRVSMSLMHSILSDDHGSASLKLSTSLVDGSGALLLCGSYPAANSGARFQPNSDRSALQNSFQAGPLHAASAAEDDHDMYGDDDNGGGDWGGGGDDYDGFHGDDDPAADPFPYADSSGPMTLGTPTKSAPSISVPTMAAPVAASSSSNNSSNGGAVKRRAVPLKDMFAQLDPHQAQASSREARRGKTYKLPLSLTKPPSSAAERGLDHLFANVKLTNEAAFLSTGAVPAKGLFDTSLLPILQLKRKKIRQARLAAIRATQTVGETSLTDALGGEVGEPMQYQNLHLSLGQANLSAIQNTSRVEELWSQDYADDADFGGDYGGDDDYEGPDERGADSAEARGDHFGGGGGGEDAAWAEESEEEALARRVANVLNEELNESSRGSYESICQKYIDNFNQGAHLFAKETQLSRRVAEWTQRLEPILQQQEEGAQFDIHAYCETFLEGVDEAIIEHDEEIEQLEAAGATLEEGQVPGEVSFGEVVAGQSSAEVCRIFLACLQLVNHGSISITPAADVNQWTFLPSTAKALRGQSAKGVKSSRSAQLPNTAGGHALKGAINPFRIRRIKVSKPSRVVDDIENYRAPSLNKAVRKGALKSASSLRGAAPGTKRVQLDMVSNITITI